MTPGAAEESPCTADGMVSAAHSKPSTLSRPASLQETLAAARARFEQRNPISQRQHEVAIRSLPGGNTRTLLHTSPFPVVMKRGQGSNLWSEDGHEYVDFVGELTAGLYGHSHPVLRSAIVSTLDSVGMNLGATTIQEQRYAALLCARFRLGRVRFANSGTEANLHALGAARFFTRRRRVVVFSGAYHGAVLSFGRGGVVPPNNVDRDDWIVARYNDVESAREAIESAAGELAAVIVEPMQGSGGCIPGRPEFLLRVQEMTRAAGALFVLDEVMTSRLAPGGMQSVLGLQPDLTTLGKYLGGGFAFGAFGGRADVMAVYDPRADGSLAHSGTFNNNTMAMHAGYAGLATVYTPDVVVAFNARGDELRRRLQAASRGTKFSFTGIGSLIMTHASESGMEDIEKIEDVDELWELKDLFWFEMMEDGFWIHRRGSIVLILDTPDEGLDRFVDSVGRFLERHRHLVSPQA